MLNQLQLARAKLLLLLICLAYAGLAGWLTYLQLVCHDELAKMAEDNTQRKFWQAARRGDILDVNGNILATSVTVKRICANPSLIGNQAATVAHALAPLLQMSEADLAQKLTPHISITRTAQGGLVTNETHYVRLTKNYVSEDVWQRVFFTMTNLTAPQIFGVEEKNLARTNKTFLRFLRNESIFAESDQIRTYPNGPLAAQVVGFSAIEENRVVVKRVCANISLIGNQQVVVAHALAPLLQMDERELAQKLLPRYSPTGKGGLITQVRLTTTNYVSEDTWQQIATAMTNLSFGVDENNQPESTRAFFANLRQRAIYAETGVLRNYSKDSLAAQVIGFSTIKEDNTPGRSATQIYGCDGIEASMDKPLSGVAGWRMTETDRQQHELVALRDEDVHPRDGLNVVLTLDEAVQHIVETALADAMQKHTPKSITGIVIRPQTGEILAMASLPNYDPNNPNTVSTNGRNRVINDIVEPGSTFKIVVVSGALNEGVVKLNDTFFCENGHFAFAGRVLHDHEAYGNLTTEGIITKSSNIGAAKIGIKLGEQSLYDYAWNYGFGQRTGILLPGEQGGILNRVKDWSKVSIAQIPMGHGVAVTRLQMAMAMGAIANDGWLMRPMIVSQLQERDGGVVQRYRPEPMRQVVSEATCKQMIEALKTVVLPGGTAPEAALKNYVVAGKTGTAQKVENGTYASGKFISSFIGFFPADKPELLISVVMDEPKEGYYGGKVCGPVFKEIAERCASYLNIPPDPNRMTNAPPLVAETGSKKF
jgi:cell division protein FtsI/penicillin-binding protein 2